MNSPEYLLGHNVSPETINGFLNPFILRENIYDEFWIMRHLLSGCLYG